MYENIHKDCNGDIEWCCVEEVPFCEKCNEWIWDEEEILSKVCIIPEMDVIQISQRFGLIQG